MPLAFCFRRGDDIVSAGVRGCCGIFRATTVTVPHRLWLVAILSAVPTGREVAHKNGAILPSTFNTESESGGWFTKLSAHALGSYTDKSTATTSRSATKAPADAIVDERIKMAAR